MKQFISILILIISTQIIKAQAMGDYKSVGTGNWTTLSTWNYYNGTAWVAATSYPGQNTSPVANNVTISSGNTVNVPANLTLVNLAKITINGGVLSITNNNVTLVLPANTKIGIINGGSISVGTPCSSTKIIQIGTVQYASCSGGSGMYASFAELNTGGGSLTSVPMVSPASILSGQSVVLSGNYSGFSAAVPSYSWTGTGPGGYTYNSTAQNPGNLTLAAPGLYTFRLTATSSNNGATISDFVDVIVFVGMDSDGDLVGNSSDLDDDNDGILDTTECNSTNKISNGVFPTTGGNTNSVPGWTVGGTTGGIWTAAIGKVNLNTNGLEYRRDAGTVTTLSQPLSGNLNGAVLSLNNLYWVKTFVNDATTRFTFTISYGGTVYATIDSTISGSDTPTVTASNGATVSSGTLPSVTVTPAINAPIASAKTNITITLPSTGVASNGTLLFTFTAGTNGTEVRDLGMSSVSMISCGDTDSDGTQDYLDLDSDNDGCFDATEGDENVTAAQLNANGSISGAVNIQGVPALVNSGGAADIGSDQGQGIGQSIDSSKNDCLDSDGDGLPNWQDLDDDNDGILDTNENYNCLTNVATGTSPSPSATVSYSGLNITYTASGNTVNTFTAPGIGFAGLEPHQGSTITYTYSLPVYNLKMWFTDLDNREFVKINYYDENNNRIGNLNPYITANVGDPKNLSYDSNYGLLIDPTRNLGDSSQNQYIELTTPFAVKKVEVTMNSVRADGTSYTFTSQTPEVYIKGLCFYGDTDSDGIPDYLDLDSDNDGCLDALEGGVNLATSNLVTAGGTVTVGTGSTASNQNLGNTVDANGVPTVASGGQSVGTSGNPGVKAAVCLFCYKPATTTGSSLPTNYGITALGRAGLGNGNWPMVRNGAWTALEAKTKGFVINRISTTAAVNAIPNPVEGMMVYDAEADCLKINTNGTSTGWKCFNTQTCP